ncbi:MAG TPA: S8 family serine peptidase, partial [Anaerolineaceae bacterium]|nr:S8 family serine peptidase [Anaerolineaceae bacterium]
MHKKSTYRVLALLLALGMLFSMLNTTAVQASDTEPQASITVAPEVLTEMETKGSASYWIEFSTQPDLSAAYQMSWSERGWYVYDTLSKAAKTSQARVASYLENSKVEYQSYWIKNTILVESSNKATLNGLMSFPEIKAISPRQNFILYEPDKSAAIMDNGIKAIEPNLTHINADDVWAMGINGAGMVVANIDTGVRFSHQALVAQYRGNLGGGSFNHNYNWFNPDDHSDNVPRDGNGHGTHTMGTMVGNDGGSNQIGIAPGAKWIACAGCPDGGCTDSALLGCGQFIAAPTDLNGANANPDKRPNAVNNSWGDCSQSYDNWFEGVISAWHAGGVYPIFSNGNSSNCGYSSPPGLNTVGNPARSGNVTGVGSSGEQNGQYASHSNWGPTDNADTVNPTGGFIYMKPQVIAPGVSIRSSTPGSDTEYQDGWSGTSMSAPHVTGLVALIWQAAPCLVGDYAVTENVIEQTAVHLIYNDGSPDTPTNYPNYATGWGEIDALAAVNYASGLCAMGTLQGTVTSDGTTPVEGVKVHADNGAGFARNAITAADGTYSVDLTEGTYTITASKYGNDTVSVSGVVITEGLTTTQDFVLAELGTSHVSGVVYDDGVTGVGLHGYPLYAAIHITAEGFDDTFFSDPFTGQYGVELVQNTPHTFTVTPIIPGYTTKVETVTPISYATSQDFPMKVSETCSAPGYLGSGVNEGFESGALPPGWVNYDYAGSGQVWRFDDPAGRGNLTPGSNGGFAVLDSDYYGYGGSQDAGLRTPVMDFSGESSVTLDFDTNYNNYSSDKATVRVSNDNGATWTDVWSRTVDFVGHVHLDISAQAAGKTGVIVEFRYTGSWDWWWQVDDVLISPLHCGLKDGGVVAGFVYDDNDYNPIIGADVSSADVTTKTFSVADDPNNQGLYWVFQPSSVDPEDVDFTAAKALYGSQTKTVSVKQDDITQQDFYLGSGELEFDPGSFEVTMQMGDPVHTETLTIENYGSANAMYELVEKDAGFVPPLSIPAFTDALPKDNRPVSMGRAPDSAKGVGIDKSASGLPGILAGAPAYAIDVYPGYNLVNIPDTEIPGVWNVIGSMGSNDFFAGDFIGGDFSTLYAIEYNTNDLYAINTTTAAQNLIGKSTPPVGMSWTGLTGTPDGTMYGLVSTCSDSSLVTVDVATGAVTLLGGLPGVDCGIDLAYNTDDGMIYIVDIASDNLFKVNPDTLAVTNVGSLGVNANYAQGLDYEEETGVLYWAAYTSSGELRVIDTATGASSLVGAFPGGAETDCLAFATGGVSDVPWLSEDPASGTVDAFGQKEVTISFDPTGAGLTQPGDYLAELKIKHNTPYTYPNI